ncbi:MAG: hypothetical protein IKS07_00095 [Lachnospiraceae bacterium]|nr:hypothetical protein [Lachnospiraceae bacterium]
MNAVYQMNHGVSVSRMSDSEYRYFCARRSEAIRRMQIRRMCVLALAAFLLIFGIAVSLRTIRSQAHTETSDQIWYRYSTIHTVRAGEDLMSIADLYMDDQHYASPESYCREVLSMNRIYEEDADLKAGTVLLVPYYSTERK